MIANTHRRPTYFEANIKPRQLWHRRVGYVSHIRIKYLAKLVVGIQLDYPHLLKDNYMSEDNLLDNIISSFLLQQQPINNNNLLITPLLTPTDQMMAMIINRGVCKAYVISKQTLIVGHKPITLILRLLQRANSDI